MPFTFPASTNVFQHVLVACHARKLLEETPFKQSVRLAASPQRNPGPLDTDMSGQGFNIDVVMVLVVLICALICSLGLHSIVRCSLTCSRSTRGGNSSAGRVVNKGVKQKDLNKFATIKYAPGKLPGLDTDCVICLSGFAVGDSLRILPNCNHGFHVKCIDKWLRSHSSCPTCRHCLIETSKNVAGNSSRSSTEQPATVQEIVIRIAPVDREGMAMNP